MECKAITNLGIQCSRTAELESKYCWQHQNYDAKNNYFQNIPLFENTLLTYFSEEEPLKNINKQFQNLEYEKYNTHSEPHGIKITYYSDTKTIDEKSTYKNGILDGLYEKYYKNSQLYFKINYKNGKKDGLFESWYDNNRLEERSNYKNGKYDGLYERWYYTGILRQKINYKNDKKDGLYEYYYDNGQLMTRSNYKDGKKDGLYES